MKINFKKYIKTILILGVVFVGLGAGYFLVLAQVVSDSFANLNFVADTWRTTVDTSGGGRVTLEEKSCDDDNWFCAGVESCANTLGDGDYILVAREDVSTSTYQWKTSNTSCVAPHCEVVGGDATLVADNTVNFWSDSTQRYPARDACKEMGGRLPTLTELQCIYDEYGAGGFASAYYWSATEITSAPLDAWIVSFSDGSTLNPYKNDSCRVRCVLGW